MARAKASSSSPEDLPEEAEETSVTENLKHLKPTPKPGAAAKPSRQNLGRKPSKSEPAPKPSSKTSKPAFKPSTHVAPWRRAKTSSI